MARYVSIPTRRRAIARAAKQRRCQADIIKRDRTHRSWVGDSDSGERREGNSVVGHRGGGRVASPPLQIAPCALVIRGCVMP